MFTSIYIILISYLIGSISGGIIIGKIKNVDVTSKGSKASGATNVLRTIGFVSALIVLVIDVYKGYFSVIFVPHFFNCDSLINQTLAGGASILGHVYPLYFRFKGGKGVGTALGTLLAFHGFSNTILIAFSTWILSVIITGFVGLSSILASLSIPIIYFSNNDTQYEIIIYSTMIALFIVFTHRENIYRMINGRENQFKKIMLRNLFK